jgi:hypothetical protein
MFLVTAGMAILFKRLLLLFGPRLVFHLFAGGAEM